MFPSAVNPLLEIHRQAQAETLDWAGMEIVETFGEPQAEYAALHKSCGLMDLPQRGILELTGKDRLPFLNNLLSNQTWDKSTKTGLQPGRGIYAFLLNLKGRIVADMNVLELADRTLVEMEARLVEPVRNVLERYLFAEQVHLASRLRELHEFALYGPDATEVLGVNLPDAGQVLETKLFECDVVVWRDDPAGAAGYHIICRTDQARTIWMNLISRFGQRDSTTPRRLRPIGWAAFNAARIEAGRPIFGIDFDGAAPASAAPGAKDDSSAGALPAETGLFDRAVSVTKGCYLGQEIVARMHARGQVARQVVGIRMDDDALPIAGAEIVDDQSNRIGIVTSSTVSPVLSNAAICLATVKRPHFLPGTRLRIAAEGAIRTGTVVATPFQ